MRCRTQTNESPCFSACRLAPGCSGPSVFATRSDWNRGSSAIGRRRGTAVPVVARRRVSRGCFDRSAFHRPRSRGQRDHAAVGTGKALRRNTCRHEQGVGTTHCQLQWPQRTAPCGLGPRPGQGVVPCPGSGPGTGRDRDTWRRSTVSRAFNAPAMLRAHAPARQPGTIRPRCRTAPFCSLVSPAVPGCSRCQAAPHVRRTWRRCRPTRPTSLFGTARAWPTSRTPCSSAPQTWPTRWTNGPATTSWRWASA